MQELFLGEPRAWASLAVASEAALSWTWLTTLEQSEVAELAHVGHWAARTQTALWRMTPGR